MSGSALQSLLLLKQSSESAKSRHTISDSEPRIALLARAGTNLAGRQSLVRSVLYLLLALLELPVCASRAWHSICSNVSHPAFGCGIVALSQEFVSYSFMEVSRYFPTFILDYLRSLLVSDYIALDDAQQSVELEWAGKTEVL